MMIMIRPQEFVDWMKGWPILDFLAFFCLAGVFLEGSIQAVKFKRSPLNTMVIFFWFAIPISLLAQLWFGGALTYFNAFAKVIIVYLMVIFTVDSMKRVKIFVWAMVGLSGLLALQAAMLFFTGKGLFGGKAIIEHGVFRARGIGIFEDPNDLALNIITWVPFLLPKFHKPFMSRNSIIAFILLLLSVAGVYFTRSRGGMLGLGAVMAFYFYRRVGWFFSLAPIVVLVLVLLTMPRMGGVDTEGGSGRTRMEHWSAGMTMFKSHPVFGVGYLRFGEFHPYTAHNSFILVLAEMGFMGIFIWVSMFYCSFREISLMRALPRPPPYLDSLLNSLQAALVGWLVSASFLSQSYKHLSFIVMALVVATMNALAKEGYDLHHPWTGRQLRNTFVFSVGGVIFMYVALRIMWR